MEKMGDAQGHGSSNGMRRMLHSAQQVLCSHTKLYISHIFYFYFESYISGWLVMLKDELRHRINFPRHLSISLTKFYFVEAFKSFYCMLFTYLKINMPLPSAFFCKLFMFSQFIITLYDLSQFLHSSGNSMGYCSYFLSLL